MTGDFLLKDLINYYENIEIFSDHLIIKLSRLENHFYKDFAEIITTYMYRTDPLHAMNVQNITILCNV